MEKRMKYTTSYLVKIAFISLIAMFSVSCTTNSDVQTEQTVTKNTKVNNTSTPPHQVKDLINKAAISALSQFKSSSYRSALNAAKKAGYVGENEQGYIQIVEHNNPPAKTKALVQNVNKERKEKYLQIAKKIKGATLSSVERIFGNQIIDRVRPGDYVYAFETWHMM